MKITVNYEKLKIINFHLLMSSSVDQIKSKIEIVSLVSSYMKLEKAGANFKGKCPFHNEKTPSFFVSPDRGSYYCFGCQAKGDIFTFVEEFEGLDFVGALKVLADRAGVVLEKYDKSDKTEKERLHSVLEQAVFFYQKKLPENKFALDYLHGRAVTDKTIDDFRIGYAPLEWRNLFEHLLSRGVSEKDMIETGLIKKQDSAKPYDTFRGRIMFPISDSAGRTVAFSGRILEADPKSPKYLNSPETSLFNKSEILFGFDKAKKDIRLRDYSILVEGQMDLIMLHQSGFSNAVASSGTALTAEHLIKLRRLSNRIIMAFDGDRAGFLASDRNAKIALSLGMELKIAEMPAGQDPADLAKDNPEALKESIKQAKHIIDFYTDALLKRGIDPRELGQEVRKNILPYIAVLPSAIEKSHFIKSIAQKTFIREEALWEDLSRTGVGDEKYPAKNNPPSQVGKRMDAIERRVIGFILWQEKEKTLPEEEIKKITKQAEEIIGKNKKELEKEMEKEREALLFETEAYYNNKTDLKRDMQELLLGLEEEYLKKRLTEAMVELQKAEQSRDSQKVLKYLEDCQRISGKIDKIKNEIKSNKA